MLLLPLMLLLLLLNTNALPWRRTGGHRIASRRIASCACLLADNNEPRVERPSQEQRASQDIVKRHTITHKILQHEDVFYCNDCCSFSPSSTCRTVPIENLSSQLLESSNSFFIFCFFFVSFAFGYHSFDVILGPFGQFVSLSKTFFLFN